MRAHPIFQRQGEHLYCEVPIALTLAALGGDIEIPTLGGKVKLQIPSETQTGKIFKLANKGVKSARGGRQGDLLCRVIVETPVDLTKRQKELLEEFAKETESKNNPQTNKWLQRAKHFLDNLKS
jgi:molecular chaperone DnaJ